MKLSNVLFTMAKTIYYSKDRSKKKLSNSIDPALLLLFGLKWVNMSEIVKFVKNAN